MSVLQDKNGAPCAPRSRGLALKRRKRAGGISRRSATNRDFCCSDLPASRYCAIASIGRGGNGRKIGGGRRRPNAQKCAPVRTSAKSSSLNSYNGSPTD